MNPLPVNGIEPGTYDVYVKGQSSVGVLIENVEFGAGAAREIRGLVLREGDLDTSPGQVDRININDFAQLSGSYGTSTFSAVNPRADMNQSGYIDVLDFSLLASNYGTATSTFPCFPRQAGPSPSSWTPVKTPCRGQRYGFHPAVAREPVATRDPPSTCAEPVRIRVDMAAKSTSCTGKHRLAKLLPWAPSPSTVVNARQWPTPRARATWSSALSTPRVSTHPVTGQPSPHRSRYVR
ncbi:MAG: hypothetical protein EBT47_05960 [Chloroflexi bacterium]|nr:hypothetical protein [Chloroflexota bacterium]